MNYELFHKGRIGKKNSPPQNMFCLTESVCVAKRGRQMLVGSLSLSEHQPPSSAWTRNPCFLSFTLADKTVAAGLSHYPTDYYMICQNCPGNDIQTVWNPKLEIHSARHLILFSKRIIFKKCWFGFLYTQIQKQTQSILKILSPDLGDVMAFKIGAGFCIFVQIWEIRWLWSGNCGMCFVFLFRLRRWEGFGVEIGAGVLSQVQHSEKVTNGSKKRERGTLKQIQRHNFQQLVFLVQPYKKTHVLQLFWSCPGVGLNKLGRQQSFF